MYVKTYDSSERAQHQSRLQNFIRIRHNFLLNGVAIKENTTFEPFFLFMILFSNQAPHHWLQIQSISSSGYGRKENVFKSSNNFRYTFSRNCTAFDTSFNNFMVILNTINYSAAKKNLLCMASQTFRKVFVAGLINLSTSKLKNQKAVHLRLRSDIK